MPAALCGVFGFKPTFGRIPHSGVLPLNWTVGMVGILSATMEDSLLVYAAISGELPSNRSNNISIIGVTIPEIENMRLAHYTTIGSECSTSLSSYLEKLNRQIQIHDNVFSQADVIVTPTTGVTAYPIFNDALKTGELDYVNGAALVRYSIAGNFLGYPAVTIPVGYDESGMPIGLQFIGRPWCEATLIHIAFAMQALCIQSYRKPENVHLSLENNSYVRKHLVCYRRMFGARSLSSGDICQPGCKVHLGARCVLPVFL
ncbi:hypothetical protein G4B88_002434 [Cannabis sativa]|uniref:Amidase domain-containing protein n=1 Tax=Cannabis sativa TaxID=3483 RepID=A0A7J6I937_CANSA|nr:hypothetical protein G4B88_002434 [Cannabis sativa]